MRALFLFIFSFCLFLFGSAQNLFFIYLESNNGTSFYIRTEDKIYSSSASGYLILSRLPDNNHTLFIGFPSLQKKEIKFNVSLRGTDRGFAIKEGNKGLQLLDLQNGSTINPSQERTNSAISYESRNDPFTVLLAKALDDSSLLLTPVFAKAEEKTQPPILTESKPKIDEQNPKAQDRSPETTNTGRDTSTIELTTNSKLKTQSQVANAEDKNDKAVAKEQSAEVLLENSKKDSISVLPAEEYKKSVVKKYAESSTSEGFGLVFLDTEGSAIDTIQLLIPHAKIELKDDDTVQSNEKVVDTKKDATPNTSESSPVTKKDAALPKADTAHLSPRSAVKTECTNVATENDFFKIRKNMAARESDEAMVQEAKKSFKAKCYTTEQVRLLSTLFLTSAGKYQFFDAAYFYVSDRGRFATLQSEIKDDYYLRRFKALIGE